MANALTLDEFERLRRYLLESGSEVALQHREDIRRRLRYQFISEYELVECAKMLLLNDSCGEESNDEGITADWLSRISLDLMQRDS